MRVTEIFSSIQGESTYAGQPCVFVRLTGCNLRCRWCDTEYAFEGGDAMTVDDVLVRVGELSGVSGQRIPLVEITGGEPLLQPEVVPLAGRLIAGGYTVLVETSGERFVGDLPRAAIKIVDVKCPGSGEGGTFNRDNLTAVDDKDEFKFVIADETDYEWARDFVRENQLSVLARAVHFSPVQDELDPRLLSEWILRDRLPVRVNLQLHKIIWDPAARGV